MIKSAWVVLLLGQQAKINKKWVLEPPSSHQKCMLLSCSRKRTAESMRKLSDDLTNTKVFSVSVFAPYMLYIQYM